MGEEERCAICGRPLDSGPPPVRADSWTRSMTGAQGEAHYTCLVRRANAIAYRTGQTPWDTAVPHPALVRLVDSRKMPTGRVFEPGPGLGHNALFLAQRGFDVTVADICPEAIAIIVRRADEMGLSIHALIGDVIFELEVPEASFDYVFERSFLQTLPPQVRTPYLDRMADLLVSGGTYVGIVRGPRCPSSNSQPYSFTEDEIRALFQGRFAEVDVGPTVSGHGDDDMDYWLVRAKRG